MDLHSNHSAGQTSDALRLVITCHDISFYQQFMSGIAEQYIITICQHFNQLKEIFQSGKADLLLIEVPENKTEFLKSLKNLTQNLPKQLIILLSDQLQQDELIAAFNMGIKDYFPAPVDEMLLLERVNSVVQNIKQTK